MKKALIIGLLGGLAYLVAYALLEFTRGQDITTNGFSGATTWFVVLFVIILISERRKRE